MDRKRYWILDQSAADEIGSYQGQLNDEVTATLNELLEGNDDALDNIIIVEGRLINKIVKTVVSFDDSNGPS